MSQIISWTDFDAETGAFKSWKATINPGTVSLTEYETYDLKGLIAQLNQYVADGHTNVKIHTGIRAVSSQLKTCSIFAPETPVRTTDDAFDLGNSYP